MVFGSIVVAPIGQAEKKFLCYAKCASAPKLSGLQGPIKDYNRRASMSKICARRFAVSLAVLFLAAAVLAQEPEKKTTVPTTHNADCEANTCISKVMYVPELRTLFELQDVVNTFRTILDVTTIEPKPSDHTIALKGTPEQLAIAEKLLNVLESFRSSGSHDRSSVLVYELKGRLSGTAQSEQMLAEHPRVASKMCDLTTCYIKAMYLPDLSMPELQDFTNKLRTTAEVTRTQIIPSRQVVVIRGTSEQVALAETLSVNTSTSQ